MAIWVAAGHGFQDLTHVVNSYHGNASFFPQPFFQQAFYAHFAVDVFIVLSGFCLMMPVARQNGYALKGGWIQYLVRRAKRILPPYYAALLLALSLSALRWWITWPNWESRVIQQIDFRPSAILAHIFLVQNLWDTWAKAVDGPTWSVATEFQIYLLFPLLLLPLWRRTKPVFVVVTGSMVGVGAFFLSKAGLTSCSWYIGLFAMGMMAADWYTLHSQNRHRPALLLFSFLMFAFALVAIGWFEWMPRLMWALDLLIGAGTASLLAFLATTNKTDKPILMKVLEWGPLVTFGTFSYSFYLIHAPLLNLPVTLLLTFHANGLAACVTIVSSLLLIVVLARLFYLLIERPSMVKR